MFKVSFPEKTVEFEAPLSVFDAARAAELVTRAHVAADVDGTTVGMTHVLTADCAVKLHTTADEKGKHVFNHIATLRPDPDAKDRRAEAVRLTREAMALLDREVRKRPGDWFWFNKRWILEPPEASRAP